mmetsp:Transcript_32340/g.93751  ORF Transcript_32340/g.93751 Transcript_32340/m.93751 type:complete len:201 (-) Transcript_32340:576-1178(-)
MGDTSPDVFGARAWDDDDGTEIGGNPAARQAAASSLFTASATMARFCTRVRASWARCLSLTMSLTTVAISRFDTPGAEEPSPSALGACAAVLVGEGVVASLGEMLGAAEPIGRVALPRMADMASVYASSSRPCTLASWTMPSASPISWILRRRRVLVARGAWGPRPSSLAFCLSRSSARRFLNMFTTRITRTASSKVMQE